MFAMCCLSQSASPEDNIGPSEGLHTVGSASMVDEGTQRVDAHPNRPQLIITYGVVVASKPCQQQGNLLHIKVGGGIWGCSSSSTALLSALR